MFPRDIYYFKEIPTNVDPLSVLLVNVGAVAIASRVQPAARVARRPAAPGPGAAVRVVRVESKSAEPAVLGQLATCELGDEPC